MIERDWFKRTLDVLVAALGAALALKKKGDVQAAVQAADSGLAKAFGMNPRLALGLPLSEFLSLACRGEPPTPQFLKALAETFLQWADVLRAAGRAQEADWAAQRAQECAAYQVRE